MLVEQLAIHNARLAELLRLARDHVPAYGALPRDLGSIVESPTGWRNLPLVQKSQVQRAPLTFCASQSVASDPNVGLYFTSGSTGVPLGVYRDRREVLGHAMRIWAARSKYCKNAAERRVLTLQPDSGPEIPNGLHFTENGVVDLSFEAFDRYADRVARFQPEWMIGFASVVARFATYYDVSGRRAPQVEFAEVLGEGLLPHQRTLIQRVFGCPVANMYGCREFDVLAYECKSGTLHAWTDRLLLETVPSHEVPGQEEIVVTSLTNRVMPLIRYRLGDFVKLEPSECPCGNPRPSLVPTGGRSGAGAMLRAGSKVLHSSLVGVAIDEYLRDGPRHAVAEYQMVQRAPDAVELYVVAGAQFDDRAQDGLVATIARILEGVACSVTLCDELPERQLGKARRFVSHLNPPDQAKLQ